MTRIVQIAPFIGRGSGVAGVAWNLDREFRARGVLVESFTLETARSMSTRRGPGRRAHGHRFFAALALFRRMLWFSTVGTIRARRFLAERPDAVAICHNGVLAGDIYVNHGVVGAAMAARGHGLWRMLRNPTHPVTYLRDLYRYRRGVHSAVVALAPDEVQTLRRTYGRVRSRIVVIPNGVDLDRFHPPTAAERDRARTRFRLQDEDRVALFIGHELSRKGIDVATAALESAPTVMLLVVGGDRRGIDAARAHAEQRGVGDRVLFVGPQQDVETYLAASDMFLLPSAYEANALVVLEALASGLPVVATGVGFVPEILVPGDNGYIVRRDPVEIADRLEELAATDLGPWRDRCRRSAEEHGWATVANRYLDLVADIERDRATESSR
ncbi:hypothetical protein GCM10027411_12200 [Microbacterium aureliae]